jgi:hypothetical protein
MSQDIRTAVIQEDLEKFFAHHAELADDTVKNTLLELSIQYRSFVCAQYLYSVGGKIQNLLATVQDACSRGHFETIEWLKQIDPEIPYNIEIDEKDENEEMRLLIEKSADSKVFNSEIPEIMRLESMTSTQYSQIQLFAPLLKGCIAFLTQLYEESVTNNNMEAAKILHSNGARLVFRSGTLPILLENKNAVMLDWLREVDKPVHEKYRVVSMQEMDEIIARDDERMFDLFKDQFEQELLFDKCIVAGSMQCIQNVKSSVQVRPMTASSEMIAYLSNLGYNIVDILNHKMEQTLYDAFTKKDISIYENLVKLHKELGIHRPFAFGILELTATDHVTWLLQNWTLSNAELVESFEMHDLYEICDVIVELKHADELARLLLICPMRETYQMADLYAILVRTEQPFLLEKLVDEYMCTMKQSDISLAGELILTLTLTRVYAGRGHIMQKAFDKFMNGFTLDNISTAILIPTRCSQQIRTVAYDILRKYVSADTGILGGTMMLMARVKENAMLACMCDKMKARFEMKSGTLGVFSKDAVKYMMNTLKVPVTLDWIFGCVRNDCVGMARLLCDAENFHPFINNAFRMMNIYSSAPKQTLAMFRACPRHWRGKLPLPNVVFHTWALKYLGLPKEITDEIFMYML